MAEWQFPTISSWRDGSSYLLVLQKHCKLVPPVCLGSCVAPNGAASGARAMHLWRMRQWCGCHCVLSTHCQLHYCAKNSTVRNTVHIALILDWYLALRLVLVLSIQCQSIGRGEWGTVLTCLFLPFVNNLGMPGFSFLFYSQISAVLGKGGWEADNLLCCLPEEFQTGPKIP